MRVIPNRLRGRRPSPSLVVSIIALVVAMGGTATAAGVLIKSSSQIARNAVNGFDIQDGAIANRDLKNNAVTGDKVRNGSIAIDDLESQARQALQDQGTAALEAYRLTGPSNIEKSKSARVATLSNVPPGTYAIFGKTMLTAVSADSGLFGQGETTSGHCVLDAGGDTDEARGLLGTPGANSPGELHMQITRTFGSTGTVSLTCDVQPATWSASNTTIIAVRVARAPRTPVEG